MHLYKARKTVQLLKRKTLDFISPFLWPPKGPDLNPVDLKKLGLMRERVYKRKFTILTSCASALLKNTSGWTSLHRVPSVVSPKVLFFVLYSLLCIFMVKRVRSTAES